MRGKLGRHAAVAIFVILMLTGLSACTIDEEEKVLSSSEKIAASWQTMLDNGLDLVHHGIGSCWLVSRYVIVGLVSYDVEKTDSLVSPYQLILTFKVREFHNGLGADRNGHYDKSEKKWFGFKTAEEALAHRSPDDFVDNFAEICKDRPELRICKPIDCTIYYAFQKNAWVYKGGNKMFEAYINSYIRSKENIHYIQDLLVVPLQ